MADGDLVMDGFTTKTLSDIARAVREGRAKGAHGATVVVDTVFAKSSELVEIAEAASSVGDTIPIADTRTWSIVKPTGPLGLSDTTSALWRFNETSGVTATDISPNNNTLVLTGSWVAGKFGNCLELNGSSQYGNVTFGSIEPLRNYLYVSCWVNLDSVSGTRPIVKHADRLLLYVSAGELKADVIIGGNTYTVSSGLIITAGNWHFVTFQYLDGNVYLGVGDLVHKETVAETTWPEYKTETMFYVGYDGTNYYDGKIDELLVDANVRVRDDFPRIRNYSMQNDALFWPFSEGAGVMVGDGHLLGTTMTLSGGIWTNGLVAEAVLFDGINDYGSASPTAEIFTGITLSIEVQIKFGADAVCPIITQANGLNLQYNGAGGIVANIKGVTNPTSIVGTLTLEIDTWYNLAVVYDGVNKELWVNGQKYGEIACTGTAVMSAETMYIARDGATYGNCTVDRVRIYRGRLKPYYRAVPYFGFGAYGFENQEEWVVL